MADQEIAKHTKNLWTLMSNAEHGFWHKLREMALEVIIIVFAVTLSIWLHGLGEHRHEQQQVRHFLLGLKHDIESDIVQINDIVKAQADFDANYAYLAKLDPAAVPDPARFDAAFEKINMNSFLVPQLSRYEGFKSSGKLTNIENEALLEHIVKLYQFDIPKAGMSYHGWSVEHDKLLDFLDRKLENGDTRAQRFQALSAASGKRLVLHMQTHPQLYERYATVVEAGKQIIAEIDQAYADQH